MFSRFLLLLFFAVFTILKNNYSFFMLGTHWGLFDLFLEIKKGIATIESTSILVTMYTNTK